MKVGIIGAGFVGSTTAYTLAIKKIASQIVMIDINQTKSEAEALDILHAAALNTGVDINFGDYSQLEDASVVVVAVDGQKELSDDRMGLLETNSKIIASIAPGIVKYAPNSIVLIATNPVDVMTSLFLKLSNFPKNKVIGSGTILDTARFRELLSAKFDNVAPNSIHAYVLGEHGKSSLIVWSNAYIGGAKLEDAERIFGVKLDEAAKQELNDAVIDAGFKIYRGKKATYYGIASSLVKIISAIFYNSREILSVSSMHERVLGVPNVCLSLPTIVDRSGAHGAYIPSLSGEEFALLEASARTIEEMSHKAVSIIK